MNWKQIVDDLADILPQTAIAEYCGTSQTAISRLKTGETSQPNYEVGVKLLKLCRSKRIAVSDKAKA